MKAITPLLGFLARAAGSRAYRPEEGDTTLTVPPIVSPVLTVPYPVFTVATIPFAAGEGPSNSWFYSETVLYNNAVSAVFASIKPGLWDFSIKLKKVRTGAINDITSSIRIDLTDINTGVNVRLLTIQNDVATPESEAIDFPLLVTADQAYTLARIGTTGLGTGTCLALITISAVRTF